jgi:hypothetical protein
MAPRKFYAIRIHVEDIYGSTYTQLYSRDAMPISRNAFDSYALGNLARMIEVGIESWNITEVPEALFRELVAAERLARSARYGKA